MRHLIDIAGTIEPDVAADAVRTRLAAGTFFWLDVEAPAEDDFALLRDVIALHPLAIEDARNFGQRPKIEDYDDFTTLIVFGAAPGDDDGPPRVEPVEVHVYYAERYLITVHHGRCPVFAAPRDQHARRLTQLEDAGTILYQVVDGLVDSFFPEMARFDEQIDQLETAIFSNPTDEELQHVFAMKRALAALRKIITPQRDAFAALVAGRYDLPGLDPAQAPYFRDVYDHLIRLSDELDTYRDLLGGAMDVYLSTVSNKLNVVMKQLGVVASFFLPLSFLTGFFGQNFSWLADRLTGPGTFLLLGLGSQIAATVACFVYFRRRGWF